MAEKRITCRTIQKHDIESNWLKATKFIPEKGEIIVYDKDSNYNYERIKIGDGSTLVSALPFVDDAAMASVEALGSRVDNTDSRIDGVGSLVGDKSVSSQISEAIANKSDSDHTHSAYVNQNAFSKVKVGSTTIAADSVTDTLTLVAGSNVTITPDAANDKVTIAATDTVYTHPSYTARTGVPTANATPAFGGTFTVSQPVSDATGHITAINSRTITIPSSAATTSASGLMSAADKTTLDSLSTLVGDTKVSEQITTAINGITHPVTSVNGNTGDVTVVYTKGTTGVKVQAYHTTGTSYTDLGVRATAEDTDDSRILLFHRTSDGDTINRLSYRNAEGTISVGKLYSSINPPSSSVVTTGGSEGQLCVVNADGTISPNARTIDSLGTGATYSLDGTTLTITTL